LDDVDEMALRNERLLAALGATGPSLRQRLRALVH
jgi:hypothetical protein